LASAYAALYAPGVTSDDNIKIGQQAIEAFQTVLQRNPNNVNSAKGIAGIYYNMKEFEKACHKIYRVPFLEPETYVIKEFDVMLRGFVQDKWDRIEKKTKQRFFVNRSFKYPGS
jgi:tetratricopeptide (TPR) repeat protein